MRNTKGRKEKRRLGGRGNQTRWIELGIRLFGMFFHPGTVVVLNQPHVSQLIHANFKQLFGENFMVKIDKPVAIPRQNHQQVRFGLGENRLFLEPNRDFFGFTDPRAKSFCEDMASDIEQSFQAAAQAGLRRPDVPSIRKKPPLILYREGSDFPQGRIDMLQTVHDYPFGNRYGIHGSFPAPCHSLPLPGGIHPAHHQPSGSCRPRPSIVADIKTLSREWPFQPQMDRPRSERLVKP